MTTSKLLRALQMSLSFLTFYQKKGENLRLHLLFFQLLWFPSFRVEKQFSPKGLKKLALEKPELKKFSLKFFHLRAWLIWSAFLLRKVGKKKMKNGSFSNTTLELITKLWRNDGWCYVLFGASSLLLAHPFKIVSDVICAQVEDF